MEEKCIDCSEQFSLTDGEVDFYKSKGFNLPRRCKACRAKKKAEKQNQGY